MDRKTRAKIDRLVWPLFAPIIGFLWIINKVFLSWWLSPLVQRRANEALRKDVQEFLPVLCTKGQLLREKHTTVLPNDYAEVNILLENMRFCVTRGMGDLNISISPSHLNESYELHVVMATLDFKAITEVVLPTRMTEINTLLRDRFSDLNNAFSEIRYPEFKKKLLDVRNDVRIRTREAEWELNRNLRRFDH